MGVILRATDNFGNKQDLDILDEGGLFCDISAIESSDIGKVYGVSSKEFMLPGTDLNNQFFGNMFDLGADPSVALNHTIYASVLIDGQEGFEGRMYINDVLKDDRGYVMYKAIVINETVDFKSRVKDLALSELDFDEYDHTLNLTNVTSSWYGDLFNGDIVYPLIDFGTSVPDTTIARGMQSETGSFTHEASPLSVLDLKPTIRLKSVIDKIFDEVDYSYSSSFFDSDYFKRIFVVSTPDEARGIPGGAPTDDNFLANRVGDTEQVVADNSTGVIDFINEVYDNGNNYDADTIYTVPFDGNFDIDCGLTVTYAALPAPGRFRQTQLNIQVNGVVKATEVKYFSGRFSNISISKTLKNLSSGDEVRITLRNQTRFISQPTFPTPGDSLRVKATNASNFSIRPSVEFNKQVSPNQIFAPDLKVRDFLQGLIEKFNLVLEPKQNERKVLSIEPFNTWRDSGTIKDWSDKVDHSVRKSIRGTMIDQAHIINLSDEEDTDYLNTFNQENYGKVFGSALYTSDSDMTEGTLEIGSFFAPTPVAAVDGTNDVVIPHIYEEDNGTKKPFAFKPRLLHNIGMRTGSDLNAYDTNKDLVGTGYYLEDLDNNVELFDIYPAFHHLDLDADSEAIVPTFAETRDLNFNNTQQFHYVPLQLQVNYYVERDAIFEYWAQYLNELYNPESKTVTMNLMFTPDEIKDIALNDQIFIDGHYYRINKISNFDLINESSTQVSLIKAPVRKFNYPVRRIYNIDGPNTGTTGSGAGGTFDDVTVESVNPDGTATYVFADDFTAATGSGNQGIVGRAATIDGYRYISNDSGSAIWNSVATQPTVEFRRQYSQGNNTVAYSADNIDMSGFNNVVGSDTNVISIHGTANTIEDNTEFISVQGAGNTVEAFSKKSAVISSTTSTLSGTSELATIIGGEDTIISGSNKSVAIGQDLIVQGGNSNIVIGNLDTTTKTVKDLINTTVINLNKDISSIENADGDHYSGIAHIGTHNTVGAVYHDYAVITGSAGGSTDLAASPYGDAYYIHLTWQGGNGTHTLNLPDTARDPLARDGNGYKRELRFFSDSTLASNKNFRLQPSGSDVIDGTTFDESLDRSFDGITIFGTPGQWFTVQRKSK